MRERSWLLKPRHEGEGVRLSNQRVNPPDARASGMVNTSSMTVRLERKLAVVVRFAVSSDLVQREVRLKRCP
jgi:hypothetical protein